jgi:hypothetical protein
MLINEKGLYDQLEQEAQARKAQLEALSGEIDAANDLAIRLKKAGITCSAVASIGVISISIWVQTHHEEEPDVIKALDSLGIKYRDPSTEADYPSSWRVFEMDGYRFPLIYGHKREKKEAS